MIAARLSVPIHLAWEVVRPDVSRAGSGDRLPCQPAPSHGFLLFLGAGLVLVGMSLALSNLRNVARRKRILATATSPISQAMGGPVEIKGKIVPNEKGLVEAPLSGRQAVWTRVTVEQYRSGSDGNPGSSSIVLNEVNGRPFFVDDDSGEVARIIPDGANVVLDQQSIGNSGQFHDPPPGFEEFLSMRGLSSKGFFGFNKTMSFYEELLAPGDALYARGPSRREQGKPNSEGSGTAPLGQLVMYAATGTGGELILTNKTEKQLASRLLRNFVIGVTCTIAGAFVIIGVIVWAPLPKAGQAKAQSDLAALQHDDNFVGGDLRALSSDAHMTGPDLAATKGDAALGTGCYNVSTVRIDATILKQDASIVSIDLSTLTSDIGTVAQDIAAMKNDLANLTTSGLPVTPRATAAIAVAGKAIGQAAAKADGEIDQVNADVTQAYSIANGMATGSCAGDGPGRPPVPIGHIPNN
jgi:hypothetical protein